MFKQIITSIFLCFFTAFTSMAFAASEQYGGQLIQIAELTAKDIAASKEADAEKDADAEEYEDDYEDSFFSWKSDIIPTNAYKNPYKVVFVITGTAKADGEASVEFDPWWVLHKVKEEKKTIMIDDGATVTAGNPKMLKKNVSAGETITFVAESNVISFQSAETIMTKTALNDPTNFTITKIEASVWADAPDSGAWWKALLQAPVILLAVVMIGLIWWWKQ